GRYPGAMRDGRESHPHPARRNRGPEPANRIVAHGHERYAAGREQPGDLNARGTLVVRRRGHGPAPHPTLVPADRRDGGGRIEAARGASAAGAEDVAAPRPDPRQPERGPPVEGGSPLIHPPVAIAIACEQLRRPQEVVPRPV